MPRQSLLRTIKRWKRYEPRSNWNQVPKYTRGLYALYRQSVLKAFEVAYIGVAGLKSCSRSGVYSRLQVHNKSRPDWSHFSMFEVHDNVTAEEIRELEMLLLGIFCDDPRLQLENAKLGSKKLGALRHTSQWA